MGTYGNAMITSITELESRFETYRAERFPSEDRWLYGNCYQFACIMRDWLLCHNVLSFIVYDLIDGHFMVMSELPMKYPSDTNKTVYTFLVDYSGVTVLYPGYSLSLGEVFYSNGKHHLVDWETYVTVDPIHWHRIRRDCCF